MSHEEELLDEDGHRASPRDKIIRMANQIGTFFESKPHDLGVAGTAEHINKFWEPRMRRMFFEVVDAGGEGLRPIVMDASKVIRRPGEPVSPQQSAQANAGVPGDKGEAMGETKSRIAASQG